MTGLLSRLLPALLVLGLGCTGTVALDDDSEPGDDDTTPAGDDDDTTPAGDDDDTTPGDDDDDTTPADDDDDTTAADDDDDTYDCDNLPQGPQPYDVIVGPTASEDFAFDNLGYLIGAENGSLFQSAYNAAGVLWVPGSFADITGLRMHPTGDVLYNDQTTGSLMRVDHVSLERRVVLSGLSEPDGLEVDLDGFAYVAEQAAGRIRRIDTDTGDFIILTEELGRPNGLSFNPAYDLLYVADWNDGYIHAIEVNADGTPGAVYPFAGVVGTGMYDGMGVDACGNVYVCDYGATSVYRIPEDGSSWDVIADLGADSTWIPNMQWGSGIGGWDAHALYVTDILPTLTYEVHVGVAAKPQPLFP